MMIWLEAKLYASAWPQDQMEEVPYGCYLFRFMCSKGEYPNKFTIDQYHDHCHADSFTLCLVNNQLLKQTADGLRIFRTVRWWFLMECFVVASGSTKFYSWDLPRLSGSVMLLMLVCSGLTSLKTTRSCPGITAPVIHSSFTVWNCYMKKWQMHTHLSGRCDS